MNILKKLIYLLLSVCLLGTGLSAQAALVLQPITWNLMGLDSNNVAVGPNVYPTGVRVCNTGPTAVSNVTANFVWTTTPSPNFINSQDATSVTLASLPVGASPAHPNAIGSLPANCGDFYFNVAITRTQGNYPAGAYFAKRSFRIDVTVGGVATASTAVREIYVEKLVSQNRNQVVSMTGPNPVYVGDTVTYQFASSTAPGGYEQLEHFIFWPNTTFQILSATSTYTAPTGAVNSSAYADACGWDSDPASATYLSCPTSIADNYTGGKAGDNIFTTYVLRVLSGGTTPIQGLIYDFSGSSYHYNSDYGTSATSLTSRVRVSDLAVTKTNGTNTIYEFQTTTYTITVTNSGPDPAASVTVADPAVAGLTKQSVNCVASVGATCPASVSVAGLEGTGLLVPTLGVNATLTFSVVAAATSFPTTVTNVVTVSPGLYVSDTNLTNNTATDVDLTSRQANLSVTKTNGVTGVKPGDTVTYVIVASNSGPSAADGTILRDPAVTGLSCTSVTCTGTTGSAVCPVSPSIANFQGSSGLVLATFPANSSVTLAVQCLVTATGS